MRVLSVACLIVGMMWLVCWGVTSCVDVANAKETTTLDDALERPVKVEKWVDRDNNVVCYWVQRYPKYLTCLQRRGLKQHNSDVR